MVDSALDGIPLDASVVVINNAFCAITSVFLVVETAESAFLGETPAPTVVTRSSEVSVVDIGLSGEKLTAWSMRALAWSLGDP